ncbi:MAG TPA: AAA family ATPase, partial [Pseudobdellovibrionaceae bacterium]
MDRYLKKALLKDLFKKIIIITGPRQVGKTTLSKSLLRELTKDFDYYNYDNPQDRKKIHRGDLDFNYRPLVLDELHKMRQWK